MNDPTTDTQTTKDYGELHKAANPSKSQTVPSPSGRHSDLPSCCNCKSHASYHVYNGHSCSCSCSCSYSHSHNHHQDDHHKYCSSASHHDSLLLVTMVFCSLPSDQKICTGQQQAPSSPSSRKCSTSESESFVPDHSAWCTNLDKTPNLSNLIKTYTYFPLKGLWKHGCFNKICFPEFNHYMINIIVLSVGWSMLYSSVIQLNESLTVSLWYCSCQLLLTSKTSALVISTLALSQHTSLMPNMNRPTSPILPLTNTIFHLINGEIYSIFYPNTKIIWWLPWSIFTQKGSHWTKLDLSQYITLHIIFLIYTKQISKRTWSHGWTQYPWPMWGLWMVIPHLQFS